MDKNNLESMMSLMKQMSSGFGDQIENIQSSLKNITVEATAGGGAVKIVLNGHYQVQSLDIQKELINEADASLLQEVLIAAFNSASEQLKDKIKKEAKDKGNGLLDGIL